MTYEDFEKFVREQCMYETMYYDSEGRLMLIIKMLDAYGIVNKAVAAEREACANLCDELMLDQYSAAGCALLIRERGAP